MTEERRMFNKNGVILTNSLIEFTDLTFSRYKDKPAQFTYKELKTAFNDWLSVDDDVINAAYLIKAMGGVDWLWNQCEKVPVND